MRTCGKSPPLVPVSLSAQPPLAGSGAAHLQGEEAPSLGGPPAQGREGEGRGRVGGEREGEGLGRVEDALASTKWQSHIQQP